MQEPKSRAKLLSSEYFGAERDFWWNDDFLGLLAKRLRLKDSRRVLDVGCGVGHWSRTLLPHLPARAHLEGVDRQRQWVRRASTIARTKGISDRAHYRYGLAESLPFAEGQFDLVTCQTVLIHVPDPRAVLGEMLRVSRPGGQLLIVEPNNLASSLVYGSTVSTLSVSERLQLVRLQTVCELGKSALGEGNDSIGDMIPGLLLEAGAREIRVYLSDCASYLVPPYDDAAQRASRDQLLDWAMRGYWLWERHDAHRYFLAGGGTAAAFDRCWAVAIRYLDRIARDVLQGTYYTSGGNVMYLISGRRKKS